MGELTTARTVIAAATQLMPSTQVPGAGTMTAVRIPVWVHSRYPSICACAGGKFAASCMTQSSEWD